MKRFLIYLLIGLMGISITIGVISSVGRMGARRSLNAYKAQLAAQGEKLTWEEWGYPRAETTNDCLPRLVRAVERFGKMSISPGLLKTMDGPSPTNIVPRWIRSELKLADKNSTLVSWQELENELTSIKSHLAEIRAALSNPPVRLLTDPTNFIVRPQFHFVQQRLVAQWFSAELIFALRQQNHELVCENLQALQQMIHLHEEDPLLINQMIRVAIAGLALGDTWEALQATNWNDAELAKLQSGWAQINLFRNLEKGLLGERLTAETVFRQCRGMSGSARAQFIYGTTPKSLDHYFQVLVTTPIWQMNREADELIALQHLQNCLDVTRSLNQGTNWNTTKATLDAYHAALDKAWSGPLGRVRHSLSARLIPSISKASWTAVRHETLRRLAMAAIALKRYELRNRSYPRTLEELVPNFLASVPIDPMSGNSICYRTNQTTFDLYSVGENGVDDGGDPIPPVSSKGWEISSGKDFVWPTATWTNR